MHERKPIAYAVDIDTGKITWAIYEEPKPVSEAKAHQEKCYLKTARNLLTGLLTDEPKE